MEFGELTGTGTGTGRGGGLPGSRRVGGLPGVGLLLSLGTGVLFSLGACATAPELERPSQRDTGRDEMSTTETATAELDTTLTDVRSANNGNVILSGVPEVPDALRRRLDPYQEVRGASMADWSEDGGAIYIATRFANVSQLHRVDMPGGARRQLTFSEEPINGAVRRPGSHELGFARDEGGSEFDQLFLFDPRSGAMRRLTDGESRNGAATFSNAGHLLAFQSTRRNGASNDVWVMDPDDPTSARMVLEAPDGTWWGPMDWSPDDSKLLIANYVSILDSRIHLLDLETGELRLLLGGDDEPASYSGVTPRFDRDGTGIFLASDRGAEFTQLVHYVIEDEAWHPLTGHIDWDVESFALSDDRTRGAFTVNEDGMAALYLMDVERHRMERVDELPVGLVGGLEFSPDGRRLGMTLNTPTTPSDVFTLELGEDPVRPTGLTRWTHSEVGGLDPTTFVEPELVRYPTFDDRQIPAWLYRPRGAGPHPVVVYIHGGPESQYRPGFSSVFQSWIHELGVAVVAPNVRGSAGYGKSYLALDNAELRENSVEDIGALLDWIADRPDLDEERVVVYGGSYGGYMVLASLVHYSDRLAGGVDIVGISDFRTFLENTQDYRRDLRRAEYGDERDPDMRAFFERISPLRQASKIQAPLFVVQGQNDPRVPVTEAEQIVRAVRANGRAVWYMNALNEGHGYARKENADLLREAVVMFFQERIGQ